MIEGAGDADTETCPITTSAKDASGVPLSIRPTADMATCTNGGSSRTSSTYDAEDTVGHAAHATDPPDKTSSACSLVDTSTG